MSNLKATPGPWWLSFPYFGTSPNGCKIMAGEAVDGAVHVASLSRIADKPIDQKEADAHLIAAAPELYEALEECVGKLRKCLTHAGNADFAVDACCEQFENALAKARGEQGQP